MNYLKQVDKLISILTDNDEAAAAESIILLKENSFTSSELLLSVTHKLLSLVSENKNIKNLIYNEVIELKNYCSSIGLEVTEL